MSLLEGIKSFFGFAPKKVENKVSKEATSQEVVRPVVEQNSSIWTSQQKLQVEDFTQMFHTPNEHTVVEVELSPERKEELLRRIADFETYRDSLSEEKQQELMDNRRYTLDGNYKDTGDKEFRNLGDVQKLVEDFKAGKLENLTNEDIAQIMSYTDTSDLEVDGKIGSFNQGMVGDCWYLSMLNNYAQTPEGAKNIAERIKDNGDGTYSVTFDSPVEEGKKIKYDITDDELKNFGIKLPAIEERAKMSERDRINYENRHYSSGDKDVRIFEVATQKLLKNYISDEQDNLMGGGDGIKQALVHKAMGYKENIVIYEKNNNYEQTLQNKSSLAALYDFDSYEKYGNCIKIFAITLDTKVENGKLKLNPIVRTIKHETIGDAIKNIKAENLTINSGRNNYNELAKDKRYIAKGHVFNVEAIDDEKIVVNDPYNSAFPHALPKEKLDSGHFLRVFYYPTN